MCILVVSDPHSLTVLPLQPINCTRSSPLFYLPAFPSLADVTLTDGRKFKLVDTAGVRKRTAVASSKDGAEVSLLRAVAV